MTNENILQILTLNRTKNTAKHETQV